MDGTLLHGRFYIDTATCGALTVIKFQPKNRQTTVRQDQGHAHQTWLCSLSYEDDSKGLFTTTTGVKPKVMGVGFYRRDKMTVILEIFICF